MMNKMLIVLLLLNLVVQKQEGVYFADGQWSPDGERIIFVSNMAGNNDIWMMNRDGTNAINLTGQHPETDLDAAWSPDGNFIAYIRGDAADDPWNLHLLNLTTMEDTRLIESGKLFERNPIWSPDGHYLAFQGSYADDNLGIVQDLFIIEVTTQNITNITSDFDGLYIDWQWSLDGDYSYGTTVIPQQEPPFGFYRIMLDTLTIERIDLPEDAREIRVSPDGKTFAVSYENILQLVDSKTMEVLSTSEAIEGGSIARPQWSPDGAFILFEVIIDDGREVWLWDGESMQNISGDISPFSGEAQVSPSGEQIMFSTVTNGLNDIYVYDLNAGTYQNITESYH
jgi:TolB protein